MSLDFDFSKCQYVNKEDLWVEFDNGFGGVEKNLNVVARSLTFLTIPIGMRSITESNYKEFWRRVDVWQKVYGTLFQVVTNDGIEPYYVTADDVEKHIGMKTNANTLTKQRFQMSLGK